MKSNNLILFSLFTSLLLFFGFFAEAPKVSAISLEDTSPNGTLNDNTVILENEIESYCLTCGGTITKDYTVVSTIREFSPWRDANKALISGGPEGGSKSYTTSQTIGTSVSGDFGYTKSSLESVLGFEVNYSDTFSETQTFNLKKNTTYKLVVRTNYLTQKVRFSVYTMGIGGSQIFKEYKYTTVKKPIGIQTNLVVVP